MQTTAASLVLLKALLFLAFVRGQNTTCPAQWIQLGNMKVFISNESLPSHDAYRICKESGGHLTYIKDAQEDWMLAGALYTLQRESVWIGLGAWEAPGVFTWVDKEPLTYVNFKPGGPTVNGSHSSKNCVAMSRANNYTWSFEYCLESRAFVCRKDQQQG